MCINVMLVHNLPNGLVNGSTGRVARYKTVDVDGEVEEVPVVNMISAGGDPIEYVAKREYSTVMDPHGSVIWSRCQVPLILAWAVTIHRAQGATLELVDANLEGCFDVGQAYIACSRATSADGLRVSNFSPECIKADPEAVEYYTQIERGL